MDIAGFSVMQLCKVECALPKVHRAHAVPRRVVPVLEACCALETAQRLVKQRQGCALVPKQRVRIYVRGVDLQCSVQCTDGTLVITHG